MPQLQLEGEVDQRDEVIESLQADVERLRGELRLAKQKDSQATRAIAALRRQLSPLYQALQAVYGEIDAVSGIDVGNQSSVSPKAKPVWESWKQKLGGKQAEFIGILLEHGEMTPTQLRIAARCGQQTVYDTISKLNKAALLNKNAGKYSLKEL